VNRFRQQRIILLVAGLAGLSAVILAAAGGHMVPALDDPKNAKAWQTASNFHFIHAIVLMVLSLIHKHAGDRITLASAISFGGGIILFCGSIYLSQLFPGIPTGNLAPVGGILLMLGWCLIMVFAVRSKSQ
jgi:uncharacterized membrane protein YgdD (TMEM256/DUF423 family)